MKKVAPGRRFNTRLCKNVLVLRGGAVLGGGAMLALATLLTPAPAHATVCGAAGSYATTGGSVAALPATSLIGFALLTPVLSTASSVGAPGAFASQPTVNVPGAGNDNADPTNTACATGANASGGNASAFGSTATASGQNSTAIGSGSVAMGSNSTAIGTGAVATRANQVAVGTATNTYTLAGINSAASLAAQSGPTRVLTTDASGNLAAASFTGQDISTLQSNVSVLQQQMKQGFEGTAIAIALGGTALPQDKRFAISTNWGNFRGQNAVGVAAQYRLSDYAVANIGIGGGFQQGGLGTRAGVMFAW